MNIFRLKILFTVILLFGNTALILAQQTRAFSLEEARDYAVKNSYSVKNAAIDIDIAKKKVWETTSIGLPQVNANLDYNDFLKIPTSLIPGEFFEEAPGTFIPIQFGTKYNMNYGFTVSQLLFNGSYLVGLQTAKIYKQLSEQNLVQSEIEIQELVSNTYYLILIAEESKNILDSIYSNLNKTYFEIQQFYKEGFVELTDVEQMKLNVSNIENTIQPLERQIEVAYSLLKFQMGIDKNETISLSDKLDIIIAKTNFETLAASQLDINKNIDYKLLNTQEKLLAMNMKNQKATMLPTLAAFFNHTENAMRPEFNFFNGSGTWFPTTLWGISLEVPVFGSGQKLSRISQARMQLDQIKNTKILVEQGLHLEAETARSEVLSAMEKYNNEFDNVTISKKIYDKTLIKYKEGLVSSSELTTQHSQYLTAQSNYIKSVSELLTAKNKLDKILGNY
ncbi:TolC family protein [Bacteroidota bacterium]